MFKKLKNYGQSTVEYVLLMAAVSSIMLAIFQSGPVQDMLGEDSELFAALHRQMEYSFRHGLPGSEDTSGDPAAQNIDHETYNRGGGSRFFLPKQAYP